MARQTRLHYENHLFNREKLPHKLLPPIQTTTDLPCPEDEDLDQVPRPAYTLEDINRVKRLLLRFVPAELADPILDMAEYWPWVGVSRNSFASAYSALDAPDKNAQWCYLVTPCVPALELKGAPVPTVVKKVRFLVKTYDSRWGNQDGPRADDFRTWFEASILDHDDPNPQVASYEDGLRPNDWFSGLAPHPRYTNNLQVTEHPGSPVDNPLDTRKRWHVIDNPRANEAKRWREVVWKHGDQSSSKGVESDAETGIGSGLGFVDSLSVGDRFMLMARALSPGWINTIFNVKIEIYYALSSSYL